MYRYNLSPTLHLCYGMYMTWYSVAPPSLTLPESVAFPSSDLHDQRRQAWPLGFSKLISGDGRHRRRKTSRRGRHAVIRPEQPKWRLGWRANAWLRRRRRTAETKAACGWNRGGRAAAGRETDERPFVTRERPMSDCVLPVRAMPYIELNRVLVSRVFEICKLRIKGEP